MIQFVRYERLNNGAEVSQEIFEDFVQQPAPGAVAIEVPSGVNLDILQEEITKLEEQRALLKTEPGEDYHSMYMQISAEMEQEFYFEHILFGMAQRDLYANFGPIAQSGAELAVLKDIGAALIAMNLHPERLQGLLQILTAARYERNLFYKERRAGAVPTVQTLPPTLNETLSSTLTARERDAFEQNYAKINEAKSLYEVEISLFKTDLSLDDGVRRRMADVIQQVGLLDTSAKELNADELDARLQSARGILSAEFNARQLSVFDQWASDWKRMANAIWCLANPGKSSTYPSFLTYVAFGFISAVAAQDLNVGYQGIVSSKPS